jgi:NADH dehydrogenase
MPENVQPHVLVIGAGFAGLYTVRALSKSPVSITLIDRTNHHLFQPLLYQVATASLSPADIAAPIRSVLRRQKNVHVLLAEVADIDLNAKIVTLDDGEVVHWDYLVLATGSTHSYFGHPEWEANARGLKTLDDAIAIRNEVLLAFEAAERTLIEEDRSRHLGFVIVGGGPTGVELAGSIAEIARYSLARDFDTIDPTEASIQLVEAAPRILMSFSESLAKDAQQELEKLGVRVRLGSLVTEIDEQGVTLADGERIEASTLLWAAGVQASPIGKLAGVETDRVGRIAVQPDLQVAGHPGVYVAGDLAVLNGPNGKPYPGVAQVAIQQGKRVAANIAASVAGAETKPFRYFNRGNLATVGRNYAIAEIWKLRLSGFPAWLVWIFIHIAYLIGFRNRIFVMFQWAYGYFTYHRRVRLITRPGKQTH